MKTDATPKQIEHVVKEVKKCGLRADVSKGQFRTVMSTLIPFPG
jgi:3-deoxy-7-phosphoheptulonate synthase